MKVIRRVVISALIVASAIYFYQRFDVPKDTKNYFLDRMPKVEQLQKWTMVAQKDVAKFVEKYSPKIDSMIEKNKWEFNTEEVAEFMRGYGKFMRYLEKLPAGERKRIDTLYSALGTSPSRDVVKRLLPEYMIEFYSLMKKCDSLGKVGEP